MDLKTVSDDEILMLINEKDENAKELMFIKYKNVIDIYMAKYNALFLKLNIDKEEAYAEAAYGFSDAMSSYLNNKNSSFVTFLSMCIDRRLIKLIRKSSTEKNKFLNKTYSLDYINDKLGMPLLETIVDIVNLDPLNKLEEEEEKELLNAKILENLSEFETKVYKYMLEEIGYIDIALMLEKTPKQIDNTIQRIKMKVKEIVS